MGAVLAIALIVFGFGYAIGLAVFLDSKSRAGLAVLCGFCAVVVVTGIVFAGCAMAFRGL